jgi:hypothetical protein
MQDTGKRGSPVWILMDFSQPGADSLTDKGAAGTIQEIVMQG